MGQTGPSNLRGSSELPGLLPHLPALEAEPLVQAESSSLRMWPFKSSYCVWFKQAGLSLLLEDISKRPGPLGGSLSSFSH